MNRPNMISVRGYKYQDVVNYYLDMNFDNMPAIRAFYAWADNGQTFGKITKPCLATMHSIIFNDQLIESMKTENPLAYIGYKILLDDGFIEEEGAFFFYEN